MMREPWRHQYVETNGLRFHCVTQGEGPLVLLLHGFPEFWYSWRHQIPVLARQFCVVAPDLRGYNETDKPEGVEAYRMAHLVEDVVGLVRAFGEERAVIIGHDWGGAIAYAFAMRRPELTHRLIVLNCPHPADFARHLFGGNLEQLQRSWYMFFFQLPGLPERMMSANGFKLLQAFAYRTAGKGTFTSRDLKAYIAAMAKPGALTAALNYYRMMFRREQPVDRTYPKITAPTLVIWGERDAYLGKGLTRGMRRHFAGPFTIRYLPRVSHWVQQEAPARVNRLILDFLKTPASRHPH